MEINKEIKDFMLKYININQSRLDRAKAKCWALSDYLSYNLDWFIDTAYQWSMAYYTVIKPNSDDENWEYDVDVAVKLKYNSNYDNNPKKYYEDLYDCLKWSDRYKDKVTNEKERAVRVEYGSNDWEFHVDLVPMFEKDDKRWVVDHKSNQIEVSWWFLFKDWVNEQNNKTSIEWSEEKFLKKIIRIFKFFRDQWYIDEIKSVQLTLLLARQVDKVKSDSFLSISKSLYSIWKSLKEELESCESIEDLDLSNPKLPEEKFNRNLDEDKFQKFKNSVISLVDIIIEAYESEDENESFELWKCVFGDWLLSNTKSTCIMKYNFDHAQNPTDLWYKYIEWWPKIFDVNCLYRYGGYPSVWYKWKQNWNNHWRKIRKSSKLRFCTKWVPNLYDKDCVLWQVTNNSNSEQKRWKIGNSKNLWYNSLLWWFVIQETACYYWEHWVKCYIVNKNKEIIAMSDKFMVNIY